VVGDGAFCEGGLTLASLRNIAAAGSPAIPLGQLQRLGPHARPRTQPRCLPALRAYTVPLNLARFDQQDWLTDDAITPALAVGASVDLIANALDTVHKAPLLTARQTAPPAAGGPIGAEGGAVGVEPRRGRSKSKARCP